MSQEKESPAPSCGTGPGKDSVRSIQDLTIKSTLDRIQNKLLIMSGKGGVGKSSIATNLAVALAKRGFRVGLIDVDLHGPSVATIMGLSGLLDVEHGHLAKPKLFSENLGVVSMASLLRDRDQAVIWRGPAKTGAIRKFISDVRWDDQDYLVVDSPPGTGDEPLAVAETIPDAKAVIVTTPQEMALGDVRKSISFCRHVHLDVLGLIENMGAFECPHCGKVVAPFRRDGGRITADKMSVEFLGALPFHPAMVSACDKGEPIMAGEGDSPFHMAFQRIVDRVVDATSGRAA